MPRREYTCVGRPVSRWERILGGLLTALAVVGAAVWLAVRLP